MAEASIPVAQDEFSCPVCLDLLKEPVTTACGHSYCKSCITDCWDQEDQKGVYSCPQCRHTFSPRPALATNVLVAEVVEKLKKTRLQAADSFAGSGDVQCDVCTGSKHKAVKSCLVCLNSYCLNHLEQHESFFRGKKHNLTDATGRLPEMNCTKHDEQLKLFCRTDQCCICYPCLMDEHKNHETVTAEAERTKKQRSAQTAVEDSERIFTELIRSFERSCSELIRLSRDQEKTAVSRTEERLERLEQEINDLRRRDAELEQLSHTQDHIQFLQSFSGPPESTEQPSIIISSHVSFTHVGKSVSRLKEKLEDFCKEEIEEISGRVTSKTKTRPELLRYCRFLTLDPNTVNELLRLSEGNRAAKGTAKVHSYPDHPDRFEGYRQVLCRESVCGRCYWELEWSGVRGVDISVSYKSISRKGRGYECLFVLLS
uniref:Uncharacterized protein n=1 Tax=Cyprinus carpio carpio TaxID=630221 RepID=A0A8C0YND1_CYPCA